MAIAHYFMYFFFVFAMIVQGPPKPLSPEKFVEINSVLWRRINSRGNENTVGKGEIQCFLPFIGNFTPFFIKLKIVVRKLFQFGRV